MPQWEYCRIVFTAEQITEKEAKERKANNSPAAITEEPLTSNVPAFVFRLGSIRFLRRPIQPSQTITDMNEAVIDLGLDGWEMVNHSVIGGTTDIFFKRPIPST